MDIESFGGSRANFKSADWLRKKKEQKAIKNIKQNKNLKQICMNEMANSKRINCE